MERDFKITKYNQLNISAILLWNNIEDVQFDQTWQLLTPFARPNIPFFGKQALFVLHNHSAFCRNASFLKVTNADNSSESEVYIVQHLNQFSGLTLGVQRVFALLVLGHFMWLVLLAFFAVCPAGLRYVHLRINTHLVNEIPYSPSSLQAALKTSRRRTSARANQHFH